ncbi:MAG: hypothetical protein ACNA8W_23820 [Bradymonadaceae bacterium]
MMKRYLITLAASFLLFATTLAPDAHAQRNPGNLGIGLGSATLASGLSVKQFAGPTAFQLTAGCWRSHCSNGVAASLDFLINMPALSTSQFLSVAWNFGGGGALGVGEGSLGAAAAFILGLEVNFQAIPIDLVLEWRPALRILDSIGISPFGAGAHLRFYLF